MEEALCGFSCCSLQGRIGIKIMGRKAEGGGSIKECGPGEALASSSWHSQGRGELLHKIVGREKSEGAEQARAGRGWWAVGLVEARWRLPRLPARWTGKGGGPPWGWNRSSSNLLPPKLDPLQFYWAWPDQARPWLLDFSVFYRTSILPSRLESFATLTLTRLIHALTH